MEAQGGNYIYKGNKYEVIRACKVKDPATQDWYAAIIYWNPNTQQTYVREINDFYNKFVKSNN